MMKPAVMKNTGSSHWKFLILPVLVILILIVGAQVWWPFTPRNEPLTKWDPSIGYRLSGQSSRMGSQDTLITLAFSGGGIRAAAFAYGVLEELADTEVLIDGQSHRLLDEVDTVGGVSGGSFTAAYFSLYGDRIFEDFESRYLKYDNEKWLILKLLAPWNWVRLLSPHYSRSDLAIEYYNEHLFDDATFGTLEAGNGPFLRINATDLSTGNPFRFDQTQFDFICSNLSSFRIARAVGASSALPMVFPPITLQNYAGTCGFEKPAWLDESLKKARVSVPRQWRYARVIASYLAQENRPYIHLIDGGISDNLGVRNPWRMAMDIEHWNNLIKTEQDKNVKRLVTIVVNSQTESPLTWAAIDQDPSVNTLLAAMTNAQIDVLSAETLDYLRTRLALWQHQASAAGLPIKFYMIEVSFHSPEDEAERKYLNGLPTTLTLPAEDVDHLRNAARKILQNNPTYQRLLQDISREH